MKFKTAREYIEYLDEQSGESWSNATNELADVMEDYAKMYHERQLKLLGRADTVGQSEQFYCKKGTCTEGGQCTHCWNIEHLYDQVIQ